MSNCNPCRDEDFSDPGVGDSGRCAPRRLKITCEAPSGHVNDTPITVTDTCPFGTTGEVLSVTIEVGEVSSPFSVEEANALALQEAQEQLAILRAASPCLYENTEQSCTDQCPAGFDGSIIVVSVPAGTYTAATLEEANALALADACAQAAAQRVLDPCTPGGGPEIVEASFSSALKHCKLIGFSEYTDSPSIPPKKYRTRSVTGVLIGTKNQDAGDCVQTYPGSGGQSGLFSVFYFFNETCSGFVTLDPVAILPNGDISFTFSGDWTALPPPATQYVGRSATAWFLSIGGAISGNGNYYGGAGSANGTCVGRPGQTLTISISVQAVYGYGIGAWRYLVGNASFEDTWALVDFTEEDESITPSGFAERSVYTLPPVNIPDRNNGVTNREPLDVYEPEQTIVVLVEPQYVFEGPTTLTNKNVFGNGCHNSPLGFGYASIGADGAIDTTLSGEDLEEDAIDRATPIFGTGNTAFYEPRVEGFEFDYQTIEVTLACSVIILGVDYRIDLDIITSNYDGSNPAPSTIEVFFTASGVTDEVIYPIEADRGYRIAVVGVDITQVSVGPTISSVDIDPNGDDWIFTMSEPVTFGAGGNGGFTVNASGGAITLSYVSGSGSDTLVYSGSRTIQYDETADIDYTQPGNGIEDATFLDMASFSNMTVNNGSGVGSVPVIVEARILSDGVTWEIEFETPTQIGGGGSGGFITDDTVSDFALTYSSGTGTDTLTFTGSRAIRLSEAPTLDYVQPGNGVEQVANSVDLPSFSGQAVTNNSLIVSAYATGGTVSTVGSDRIHSFTSDSNLVVLVAGTLDYMVVGSGSSGNGGKFAVNFGAGGAGGCVRQASGMVISVGTYPVVIGALAAGTFQTASNNGNASSFNGISAPGGVGVNNTSRTGGSNADFAGGTNSTGTKCGGGAGSGGAGSGSDGGVGTVSIIDGLTYASGGGGGDTGVASAGGGTSGIDGVASDCAANTGGGAGGGSSGGGGGDSGSGIVKIRTNI